MKIKIVRGLILLGAMTTLFGCSGIGGDTSPTRTPRAVSEATQTPIVVYIPVTTTPEPATATALPTVTSAAPTRTATRQPQPTVPVVRQPTTAPTATATSGPTNTPAPACGQAYQVSQLTFPEDGATRNTNSKGNPTIQFKFTPVATYQLDPTIGYRIDIAVTRANGGHSVIYMSHNKYLTQQNGNGMVLSGKTLYLLSGGDDVNLVWSVTVIKAASGFDDNTDQPLGTVVDCGPPSNQFHIVVAVT